MICLSDLPTGALAHISSYLAAPSRALFAVALNSRDVERSSAIAGDDWEYLDFGDIEKDLAAKLIDVDIRDVLLAIDAFNNLKRLRLTNCINISGVGLEPLRASTIIEQIDLSLVGDHESCKLDPEPPISCAEVIPILDSIIERGEECVLKHLQFPNEWRKERNTESDFHAFITRYNDYLHRQVVVCLKCNGNLSGHIGMIYMAEDEYGTQNYTCCQCMKQYCHDCVEIDEDNAYCMSSMCDNCNKRYCLNCSRERQCTSCDHWYCLDCIDMKQCFRCEGDTCPDCVSGVSCRNNCCEFGGKIWCDTCAQVRFRWCDKCNESYCADCCVSNVLHAVQICDDCDQHLCGQCRMKTCREGWNCAGCYQIAFKALTEDNKLSLRNENEELRSENNELKRKIRDGA